ncbi:hypothetical protein IWX86_003973 [Polaromonas sp. CG_9.2]|nr:hypothetical protein [Polaromonas sp. CG_9.2]
MQHRIAQLQSNLGDVDTLSAWLSATLPLGPGQAHFVIHNSGKIPLKKDLKENDGLGRH